MKDSRMTCIRLKKRHLCFLKTISGKCRSRHGRVLCRASVLRAIITVVKDLEIDTRGIRNEEELRKKIMESFGKKE
ncbi:MAG: hypothetical protein WC418_03655 [Candidatus Omnitrophota bacterium]